MYLGPEFQGALERMQSILGVADQGRIAEKLGKSQPTVHYSISRKCIPSSWLMALLLKFHINPKWILYGSPYKPYLVQSEEVPDGPGEASCLVPKERVPGAPAEVSHMQDISMQGTNAEEPS